MAMIGRSSGSAMCQKQRQCVAPSDEIGRHVSLGAFAVVPMDIAGWHKAKALIWPTNVRPLFIPAGCPELGAQENIWQ
jgi:hypothetical protein